MRVLAISMSGSAQREACRPPFNGALTSPNVGLGGGTNGWAVTAFCKGVGDSSISFSGRGVICCGLLIFWFEAAWIMSCTFFRRSSNCLITLMSVRSGSANVSLMTPSSSSQTSLFLRTLATAVSLSALSPSSSSSIMSGSEALFIGSGPFFFGGLSKLRSKSASLVGWG